MLRLVVLLLALLAFPPALRAEPPVPVGDESGFANSGFVGWDKITSGLPTGIKYLHRPRDPELKRAAVWFHPVSTANTEAALAEAARNIGLREFKLLASHPMPKAKLLDADGYGTAYIGSATRLGRTYRIAAVVVYGSLDESPRSSGVHIFAAPQPIYEELGGWLVPASLFFNLNPQREVRNAAAQGRMTPAIQAQKLAGVGNVWAQWAFDTYVQMQQSNLRALDQARRSAVCAGDPNCVMVPAE